MAGQRDELVLADVLAAAVVGAFKGGGDGEEGVGGQGGGTPAVPAPPAGDLALVQAGGPLAGLEALFDPPAQADDAHQPRQRYRGG
jgi:hypothetical protein